MIVVFIICLPDIGILPFIERTFKYNPLYLRILFFVKIKLEKKIQTNSSISLSPKSNLSNFESEARDIGSSFRRFSRSSKDVRDVSSPKSGGKDVRDISFKPRTVKAFNWVKAGGNLGIGLELKSATWRDCNAPILSGISGISKI